ncbi:MAG: hypothetical protein IAE79_08085 [Anaerolinea sp.]|nr:hypothetical protein [Anaerolinea sp.]
MQAIGLRPFSLFLTTCLILLLLAIVRADERSDSYTLFFPFVPRAPQPPPPVTAPLYGVNFITSAEQQADAQQFQNGLATGAAWDRWPLYWFHVEMSPGVYDWSTQDTAVLDDINHGLRINAILLGTPGFYTTRLAQANDAARPESLRNFRISAINSATPQGVYAPIFTDGSDVPGPGKQINPENKWAGFVFTAVSRYKPGGVLAQQQGWGAGVGITHWEVWNEPDLVWFWDGTLPDYARLLKVAYLSAKQADANAQILFAGMANNFAYLSYYADVLAIYDQDAMAAAHGYYHDIFATHSYFYAWQSWYHVWRAERTMRDHGLSKPIWLNESGVAVWNDYPGPIWDAQSGARATQSEQADYIIQSALYALFAGADAIFHFQLYDGCGNQPAGTNFPPHNGELCDENGLWNGLPCAGDANGLYRNPTDATCFAQHPQPETARDSLAAYRVLTTYVTDVYPYWRQRPGSPKCMGPGNVATPGQEWIAFYQPGSGRRVVGLWALCAESETAVIPATSPTGTALLVAPTGSAQTITAQNGVYTIYLPGATNRNTFPDGTLTEFYPIGGRPFILVEADPNR